MTPKPKSTVSEQLASLPFESDDYPEASPLTMETAEKVLTGLTALGMGIPEPFIYVTCEGHIRAEWPGLRWNVSLETDGEEIKLFCIHYKDKALDTMERFMLNQVGELTNLTNLTDIVRRYTNE